jgi:phage tail protein X
MQTYIARDGDTVDSIAWRYYGRVTASILQTVLEANRGLADAGAVLPAGTNLVLPDIDLTTQVEAAVTLWS